jgi:N-acetylglucosaminyldiphosphoundecaprenol N-acetyl-beta-D-mannosaminyltransferase
MENFRTNFLGYPVDNISLTELIELSVKTIASGERCYFAVQNANKMYLSEKNRQVRRFIEQAKIILPENAINLGMRLLRRPLKQRNMGGVHVMEELLKLANEKRYSVSLLGAQQLELNGLVDAVQTQFPQVQIKSYINGYFGENDEEHIVSRICESKPNVLFVGLGSPKQELFIDKYWQRLNANIIVGVGGSFKVLAGLEKPAPRWSKYGLEWLYRSWQDPKKLRRYVVVNSFYLYRLGRYLLTQK